MRPPRVRRHPPFVRAIAVTRPAAVAARALASARDAAKVAAAPVRPAPRPITVNGLVSDSRLPGYRLLALTEEELQRIVLDVHDGPVQYLFAALAQLTALRARLDADGAPRAYAVSLARAVESVEAALADIRRTVSAFRAPDVAERGVAGVMEELIVGHETRTGSSVELVMDAAVPPTTLATTVAIYRIVQEALSNVERHAGVKDARVRIWTEGGRLHAEVSDAGRGFVPAALDGADATRRPAHIGLRGMRERVALVNGTLAVESRPGGGTRVRASVPLDA